MISEKTLYNKNARTELGEALDSEIIRTTSYLRAEAKAPLLVYVEGQEDIPFWQLLFKHIDNRYNEINITTLKEAAVNNIIERNANGDALKSTGKDDLMQVQGLGAHKVLAVDRDFDGLIDNYHTYTDEVRTNPYVIHTTYYSIENHIVSPHAVNTYLQRIVGDEHDYTSDFNCLLTKYNSVLDPMLLLSLACCEHRITHKGRLAYAIKNLSKDLTVINNKQDDTTIDLCKNNFASNRNSLLLTYQKGIEEAKSRLQVLSKYPDGLWKVVQGHTLYAFVYNYMLKVVKTIYDANVAKLYSEYGFDGDAVEHIQDLQNRMFAPYGDMRRCVFYSAYDMPVVDKADVGIIKIINQIQNIH